MMSRMISRIFIVATLMFSLAATAQDEPLTDKSIERYIQSLQNMKSLSDRINDDDTEDAAAMAQLWLKGDNQAIVQHLKEKEYYGDLNGALKKAGFSDTEQWVSVAQRVTKVFMALEIGEQGPEIAAEMEAGLQHIRQSEQLSPVQKEALVEQLQASQAQLSNIEAVIPADRAAVKPYMDVLRKHFEEGAQE